MFLVKSIRSSKNSQTKSLGLRKEEKPTIRKKRTKRKKAKKLKDDYSNNFDFLKYNTSLDQVLGRANKDEILVLVWILKIASAKIGARDSLLIFP